MGKLEEVVASIPSEMRKRLSTGADWEAERQPLPSIGLTRALGGGLGYGRMVTFYGSKSSTKSSIAQEIVGDAQSKGKVAAWLDAEKSWDRSWAARLGVDNESLLISKANDMERAGEDAAAFVEAGVDILVVDSVGALVQPSYFNDDGTLAGMDSTHKIGDFSKSLKAFIRRLNLVNERTLIIYISQSTTHISPAGAWQIPEGGKALEFYSSQVVRLASNRKDIIYKSVESGNKTYKFPVGRKVKWVVEFNKLGSAHETGEYEFYFEGDEVGVNPRLEIIQIGKKHGVIEASGAWLKYGEENFHGEQKMLTWLENSENFERLKADVL